MAGPFRERDLVRWSSKRKSKRRAEATPKSRNHGISPFVISQIVSSEDNDSQAHRSVMPRKPLEVRLDSKRYRSRKREERRSVGMCWYDACREVQHWQFATRWHHCGRSERKRDATIRRGPYKGRAHVWHSLAAILTMVSMRRAMH